MADAGKPAKGNVKGPQQHAEGQQGEKTHARFQEQLHQPLNTEDDDQFEAGNANGGQDSDNRNGKRS